MAAVTLLGLAFEAANLPEARRLTRDDLRGALSRAPEAAKPGLAAVLAELDALASD